MELSSRGTNSLVVNRPFSSVPFGIPICLGIFLIVVGAYPVRGQASLRPSPEVEHVASKSISLTLSDRLDQGWSNDDENASTGLRRWKTRQALLIGGLAASMVSYGYFILEFNNSRGNASAAERAYEEDVRQNAQTYVDQGVDLDEIQTFRDWQAAYDDAKSSREWAARAGFLAIVIGFFAILDAATTYDAPPPSASGIVLRPTVGLTPVKNDLLVGARLKF